MLDYALETVKRICEAAKLPLDIPFIDARLEEYATKYNGAYPYYAALRDIVAWLRPGVVLEIGAWEGTSAACFAAGNKETLVLTIDHHSDPGDQENMEKTMAACDEYENMVYLRGCSTEMVSALKPGSPCMFPVVRDLLASRTLDILYVDGWHHAQMAQADVDTYMPLMSKGGLIICDDIYGANDETLFGMMDFWKGLPGEKYLDPRIHSVYSMGFVKLP